MGGSGGGFWRTEKPIQQLLSEEIGQEQQKNYKRAVNSYIEDTLKELNNRDTQQIQAHLDTLKSALEKDVEGTFELRFGGSVSKHTYANGLSDIDMLVQLNGSSLAGKSPQEVLDYFAGRIRERLPRTNVTVGELAVTVTFANGHEIQLLPCISTGNGVKIKKYGQDQWSNVIRPTAFANKLTQINQSLGGRVIPVIKLIKVLNDQLPKDTKLSGYHIESLAIEAFKNPPSSITYHDLIHHFCDYSKDAVLHPIKDRTGQSVHVDDYLGADSSSGRLKVSRAFERLDNRLKRADTLLSLDQWKDLLD